MKNSASSLFQLLCLSLLSSARISSGIAANAARTLFKRGWTTPGKMCRASWDSRVKALHEARYSRYQERTSTMLGETSELLLNRYKGDLRNLRKEAGKDPKNERRLLKEFKGIGNTGADIFFREAQKVWPELYPFIDRRAAKAASQLGLPRKAKKLSRMTSRGNYPELVSSLTKAKNKEFRREIREAA